MKKKNVLSFSDRVRALEWLKNNRERLKSTPSTEAAPMCTGEIGVLVSAGNLRGLSEEMDLGLFKSPTVVLRNPGSWHDVAAVLARSIKGLYTKLGEDCEELNNLNLIIQRYHTKVE